MGRRVWSDDEVQALAKNFLCVADEVWTLDHVDSPGGKLFKEFVKSAPPNFPWGGTTKQGIYAMTADGEFLAGHMARHDKAETMAVLRDALKKWSEISAKKGLKPKPIPPHNPNRTWGTEGLAKTAGGDAGDKAALILEVCVRDLPFKGERHPGPPQYRNWFNQTWADFTQEEMMSLLPKGGGRTVVPDKLFRKLAQDSLLDFVRGQTGRWEDPSVRKAQLTVEPVAGKEGSVTVRYQGEFAADDGQRGFECKLYGKAVFDSKANRFKLFELVAAGMRHGRTEFFRGQEPPSPLGLAFIIEDQYAKTEKTAKGPTLVTESSPTARAEEKKGIAPDVLAAWDARLRALVASDLGAGRKTKFTFKLLGQPAEITLLEANGAMKLLSGGSEAQLFWSDLALEDKRALAVARARDAKSAEETCLAAFYQFACGDEKAGETLLKGAPPAEAEKVRAALKN